MHAMGPNVAGVIGSAVAAGVLSTYAIKIVHNYKYENRTK